MARTQTPISNTELSVLKVLWTHGPGTVRDVEVHMPKRRPPLAYNTILTLLSRLRQKGYVVSEQRGQAHVFRPAVTRDEVLGHGLKTLVDRICDGTASPLVHALVKGRTLSADDIAHFRRLLDELERKG